MAKRFESVEEYVASYPPDVRARLEAMRAIVRAAAPTAEESISQGMPTYRLGGRALVHFAGWTRYLSLYPTPDAAVHGDLAFEKELAPYRATRSTARFPLDRPLPHELVGRLVELLVARHAQADAS